MALYRLGAAARREVESIVGHPVSLEIEPGRYVVGEAGVLVAEVRALKRSGGTHYTLVDAGFDNLPRPVMYGSHHEISVVKRQGVEALGPGLPTVVGGPLFEAGDVFTQTVGGGVVPREIPEAEVGDYVLIHDAGAYAASMASNYNTRPLAPEILLEDGQARLIRRRQRVEELIDLEEV